MNHKQFLNKLDKDKNMFDLENLIILSEYDYNLRYGRHGEVDRAYINRDKNYAYVIEYKSTYNHKTHKKAKQQCNKDKTYINERYKIDKDRIFCFEAYSYGKGKKEYKIHRI